MRGPLLILPFLSALIPGEIIGMSSQAYIPVQALPIDPIVCFFHWAPVLKLQKEALDAIVTLLLPLKPVIPTVDKLVRELKAKQAAQFAMVEELATGNLTLAKSGKNLQDWLSWQQRMFIEFGKSSAAEMDSVFDSLTPELRGLVKERCELIRNAVDLAGRRWRICMKTSMEPITMGKGHCPFSAKIDEGVTQSYSNA